MRTKPRWYIVLVCGLALLSVCSATACRPEPPAISVFSAAPSEITLGESTTLQWVIKDATTVNIDQGVGNVAVSGSIKLSPTKTIAYTLTATNAGGTVSKSVVINVSVAPAPPPPPADKKPPVIKNVSSSPKDETAAVITWTTDELATSQVKYGKTEAYGSTLSLDARPTTSHSVTISGLTPDTIYYFKITAKDASGNEASSETSQKFKTSTPIPVGSQVGNRAPDFTLQNLNGENVTLNSFRGKIVMVNFWATWCGPCVNEMLHIQAVFDNRSDKLIILAIAVKDNEDLTSVKQYITQKAYTFPVLFDSEGAAAANYDANRLIPQTFFIDANGIIQKVKEGNFYSKDEIENILRTL